MPTIDLTHNTSIGEQDRAEREREHRRTRARPQLSQPAAAPKYASEQPRLPSRLGAMLRRLFARRSVKSPPPRIPRAQRIPEPPRAVPPKPSVKSVPKPLPPQRSVPPTRPAAPKPVPPRPNTPPPRPAPIRLTPLPKPAAPPPVRRTVQQRPPAPQRDDAFDVNLVPADMMTRFGARDRAVALGLVALASAAAVALLAVALSVVQATVAQRAEANRASIADVESRLTALEAEKRNAVSFHDAASRTVALLNEHVYWTKFFSGLERYTVDTVFFRSMNADRTGRLSLAATGLDLRSVSRQLLAFAQAKEFVKSASITAASVRDVEAASPRVDFTVTITLAESVFQRTADGPATFPASP